MRLVWSERFRAELRREFGYIQARNPVAARVVRERIVKAVRRLRQYPESGRSWRLPGCRELVVPGLPYIVIYKVREDAVIVASLFHASRAAPHVH
jgi:addiction module RelE/StbE family toxin